MLWEPFLLALGLGLVISIGLYAAYRWPPDDASAPPPDTTWVVCAAAIVANNRTDSVVRIVPSVSELRLGIAMSLLGAPFFLALLVRMRRELA